MDALRSTVFTFVLACSMSYGPYTWAGPVEPGTGTGNGTDTEAFLRWYWAIDEERLALGGYDPVAYHELGRPRRGRDSIELVHHGIRYRFVSEEFRDRFAGDPDRYLPAFGGWCAFALSMQPEETGSGPRRILPDPQNFDIVDGRLLLFSRTPRTNTRDLWRRGNTEEALARAEAFWREREHLAASVGEKPDGLHPHAPLETVQFDFFIGNWESRYKVRVDPARPEYGPTIRGHWKAWYGWDGFAIYDDWQLVGGPPGNSGPAIRSYDPLSRTWVMHYIPINAPLRSVWGMTGTFDENGELHATMQAEDIPGRPYLQRVHFVNISEDHFSWRSDRSYDGGTTWHENWGMGENYRSGSDAAKALD